MRRRRGGEVFEFTEELPAPSDEGAQSLLTEVQAEAVPAPRSRRAATLPAHNPANSAPARGVPFTPPPVQPFTLPRPVPLPAGSTVVCAAAGDAHALLLLSCGRALCLGANDAHQLGSGDRAPAPTFQPLRALAPHALSLLCARGDRSAALSAAGDVALWGTPRTGTSEQASDGEDEKEEEGGGWSETENPQCARAPRWLAWLPSDGAAGTRVAQLALGGAHTLLLTRCGWAYGLGDNVHGQLGLGEEGGGGGGAPGPARQSAPRHIERLRGMRVTQLAAGRWHSAAVTADGRLFTWGRPRRGCLGHGHEVLALKRCPTPRCVAHPAWADDAHGAAAEAAAAEAEAERVRARLLADARTRRLAVLSEHARPWAPFAQPTAGQLAAASAGGGPPRQRTAPAQSRDPVLRCACGDDHTLVVTRSGAVYGFGGNARGQLGGGGRRGASSPQLIEALRGVPVADVFAGAHHSAALSCDGRLFVWGCGEQGQLGLGRATDELTPVQLPPPSSFTPQALAIHQGGDPRAAARVAQAGAARDVHPLAGVRVGGAACGSGTMLVWSADGAHLWAAGSGAFGRPGQRHATASGAALSTPLLEDDAAAAEAATAIVRLMQPDMLAPALLENLRRGGPYSVGVLSHVLRALLECLLHRAFNFDCLLMYSRLARTLALHCAACSSYAFRAALVAALEDAAVRLLATTVPAFAAALPEPAHTPAEQRNPADHMRAAAVAAAAAREGGRALGAFVRELASMGVLLPDDVAELESGCPASSHSIGLLDSALMARKLAFFARMVPPPKQAPVALRKGETAPPLPTALRTSSSEEAAWVAMLEAQAASRVTSEAELENADPPPLAKPRPGVRLGLPSHAAPVRGRYATPLAPTARGVNVKGLATALAGVQPSVHELVDARRVIGAFQQRYSLTVEALRRIHSQFIRHDVKRTGSLDILQFCALMQAPRSPLLERLFAVFDSNADGTVDMCFLCCGLLTLSRDVRDHKLHFAFNLFDRDASGLIERGELRSIVRSCCLTTCAGDVDEIVGLMLKECDLNGDGVISFEEFVLLARLFPHVLFPSSQLERTIQNADWRPQGLY